MRLLHLILTILSLDFMSSPGSARGGSDTHGLRRDDVDAAAADDLDDASSVAAAARAPAMPSVL